MKENSNDLELDYAENEFFQNRRKNVKMQNEK